jgi:predicted O-methyltransferase YrrM
VSANPEIPRPAYSANHGIGDILSPMAFRFPEALRPPLTWHEHVPFGFWLIESLAPRTIVELGTYAGTSYLSFCQAVRTLGLNTRCYAIDTWQGDSQTFGYEDNVYQSLAEYHDRRYATFSKMIRSTFDQARDRFEDGSIDLLHIDGLHTYEAARHDFETWRPKLSPRAVVLFHDSNVRETGFGVWRLWAELAKRHTENFQFFHCYGLAVLGIGTELPTALKNFFAIARTAEGAQLIRNVYVRLGTHCSATVVHAYTQEAARRALAEPNEEKRNEAVRELAREQRNDLRALTLAGELVDVFLGVALDGSSGIPDLGSQGKRRG